ncbi:MAG: TipAS antibiotic-recognition domain-containing protein [Actinomycetota bacterium]
MNDPLSPISHHGNQFQGQYSEAENREYSQVFGSITQDFAAAMADGVSPEDSQVQQLVQRHYNFCLKFWTPTKDSYKSLALSYIIPSPYREAYEAVAEGLGQYHYEAISIWAENNLS